MAYYLRKEKKKKGIYLQMYESHWDKEKKQPRSKKCHGFWLCGGSHRQRNSGSYRLLHRLCGKEK